MNLGNSTENIQENIKKVQRLCLLKNYDKIKTKSWNKINDYVVGTNAWCT